jgi:HD superfamily phosphodiesterase
VEALAAARPGAIRKALDTVLAAEEALAANVNAVTAVEGALFGLRRFERGVAGS